MSGALELVIGIVAYFWLPGWYLWAAQHAEFHWPYPSRRMAFGVAHAMVGTALVAALWWELSQPPVW